MHKFYNQYDDRHDTKFVLIPIYYQHNCYGRATNKTKALAQ